MCVWKRVVVQSDYTGKILLLKLAIISEIAYSTFNSKKLVLKIKCYHLNYTYFQQLSSGKHSLDQRWANFLDQRATSSFADQVKGRMPNPW